MRQEYHKCVDLAKVNVQDVDLISLYELLSGNANSSHDERLMLEVTYGNHRRITLNSLDELRQEGLLDSATTLFLIYSQDNADIYKSTHIRVGQQWSQLCVNATDEPWFNGIILLVQEFFRQLSDVGHDDDENTRAQRVIHKKEPTGEHRSAIDLNSVTLYRNDVVELITTLVKGFEDPIIKIQVEGNKDHTVTFESVTAFESGSLPSKIRHLRIEARNQDSYRHGLEVSLWSHASQLHIHSTNEVWFLGKISHIKKFFKRHRRIHTSATLQGMMGPMIFIAIISAIVALIHKHYLYGASLISLAIFFGILLSLTWRRSLVFGIDKPNNRINYELMGFAVAVLTLLATIVTIIVAFLK